MTTLAKALGLTKGAISKTIRKLMDKHLVESYMLDGNRQKIYYRVTPDGKEIKEKHDMRDNSWRQVNQEFLSRLSEKELRNAAHYLRQYNEFLEQIIQRELN